MKIADTHSTMEAIELELEKPLRQHTGINFHVKLDWQHMIHGHTFAQPLKQALLHRCHLKWNCCCRLGFIMPIKMFAGLAGGAAVGCPTVDQWLAGVPFMHTCQHSHTIPSHTPSSRMLHLPPSLSMYHIYFFHDIHSVHRHFNLYWNSWRCFCIIFHQRWPI